MSEETIQIFSEGVEYSIKGEEPIKVWIQNCVRKEGYLIDYINIVLCSDGYLLNLNQEHLNHDYFTDIITFQYANDPIEGELFISVDRVLDNARQLNVPFEEELHRVVIHGVLHLLGYQDKTDEDKVEMTQKEDFYLALR